MTPRRTHLLAAALAVASIAAGVLILRVMPSLPPLDAPGRLRQEAPLPEETRPRAGFLQALRGHAAPEPSEPQAPLPPATVAEPASPQSEPPAPDVAASLAFPPGFQAPLPPARPTNLLASAPLPPIRPRDLAALPGEPAPPPAAGPVAPAVAPAPPPETPAPQLAAKPGEAVLRPAPEDAFTKPQAPARFNMGDPVYVRIFKQEGQLELWLKRNDRFSLYRSYPICKWSGHLGPKIREADYQSPEGFYSVSAKQLNPNSNYHRAFNVGYPNAFDRQNGRTGGLVMVHGACKSVGCFAMTDKLIEEIYGFVAAAIAGGQREVPVHIFPFRMTDAALSRETGTGGGGIMAFLGGGGGGAYSQYAGFWRNLKEGYDIFERTGEPPQAYACGDHYAFGPSGSCRRIAGW